MIEEEAYQAIKKNQVTSRALLAIRFLLVSSLAHSTIPMMGAVGSCETSVNFYQTTLRYNPEDAES
jgi:hypothetical protein